MLRKFIVLLFTMLLCTLSVQSVVAVNLIDKTDIAPQNTKKSVDELIKLLPKEADLDDPFLLLVNQDNRLTEDLPIELASTASGKLYDARITEAFNKLITAAEEAGHAFETISAHRTIAYQAANFDSRYNSYLNEGYSSDDAYYLTAQFVAPADATEHSTGLAFDLLGYDYNEYGRELTQSYRYYDSAIWLADHAYEYGFVIRYLEGKTPITGYEYEPWHIRYVGAPHAQFMHEHGITLEEYLTLIDLRDKE